VLTEGAIIGVEQLLYN